MNCPTICALPRAVFTSGLAKDINDFTNKTVELVSSVFDIIQQAFEKTYTSLSTGMRVFRHVTGVAGIVSLFFTIYNFSTKEFWKSSSWLAISSTATLILQKITSVILYIDHLKLAALGKLFAPISYIGHISGIVSSVFDLGDQAQIIHQSKAKTYTTDWDLYFWRKALANTKVINSSGLVEAHIDFHERNLKVKYSLLPEKEGEPPSRSRTEAIAKLNTRSDRLQALMGCQDQDKVALYCQQKIVHLEAKLKNEANTRVVSWIFIAFDVAYVALTIICLAVPIPGLLLLSLSIAGLAIIANSLDLTSWVAGKLLRQQKPPRYDIGVLS